MNYLTEPVHPDPGRAASQQELLVEMWLHCQHQESAVRMGWDHLQQLRGVAYGLYLAFEQGRNINDCALAWRTEPCLNLADYEQVGYELHAVTYPGHRDEPAPRPIAEFHAPIDEFTQGLAAKLDELTGQLAQDPLPLFQVRPGTLQVLQAPAVLYTQIAYQLATVIAERIERHMVLRAAVYDDDELVGWGPDLAPGLTVAWQAYFHANP